MLEVKKIDLLKRIWKRDKGDVTICPKCDSHLTLVQLPPRYSIHGVIYDTYLECAKCDFRMKVNSYTVYGAVKDYDDETVEISSWSELGDRVANRFYHVLDKNVLKELKESGDLVEFLIVNDTVIVVIG